MKDKDQLNAMGLMLSAWLFEGFKLSIDQEEKRRQMQQMVTGKKKVVRFKREAKFRLNQAASANNLLINELTKQFTDKQADELNSISRAAMELMVIICTRNDKAEQIVQGAMAAVRTKESLNQIITDVLGDALPENTYKIKPDQEGVWWFESEINGEPFTQIIQEIITYKDESDI